MSVTLPEVIFAAVAAGSALLVALLIRGGMDRRREEEVAARAKAENPDDSGVITLYKEPISLTPPQQANGPSDKFDRWFDRAVYNSGLGASPAGVVAVCCLLGVVLAGGLYLWKEQLGLALFGLLAGVAVPVVAVSILQGRYKRKLQDQLPDAYYVLAGALRAGLPMEQAIELYAERGNKPLADEFKQCVGMLKLGATAHAALKKTGDRLGLLDFNLLVSTVGLYQHTGGNMAMLLDRLAASVRDRNQFRGQFRAITAQSRIVSTVMAAAVPLFLLAYVLFEPEHVEVFFRSNSGWLLLVGCVVLEIIGVFWVWRLFKIEY